MIRCTPLIVSALALWAATSVQAQRPAAPQSLRNNAGIVLSVDANAGRYTVTYRGQSWFGPGIVSVLVGKRWYRSTSAVYPEVAAYEQPQGKLVLKQDRTGTQSDRFGTYDFIELDWNVSGKDLELTTGFRLYRDRPFLIFLQRFPKGFRNYASGDWIVPSVVFPQFVMERASRRDLYSWVSGGMWEHRFAYGPASSLLGTVDLLLLLDSDDNTLVLSPFSHYLAATQQNVPLASNTETSPSKAFLNCGLEGLVEEIPAGFELQNILVVGQGVARTFRIWGDTLLARAGKPRPSKYESDMFKYPTYWDDYGAYYREHGFKEEGYNAYEDIIVGIAEDARKHGLRIGGYQVQDLDQLRTKEGLFEPRQDLFPHGLKWLHEKLGAPLEAYTAWLAPSGPYRKKYAFFETPAGTVPEHSMGDVFYSEQYWKDTAGKLVSWGATLLQHDFLSTYEGNLSMMAGVDKMDQYFKNMAKALQEEGIHMQYCMALPRNILQSTENPMVISLQGSLDHHVPVTDPNKTYRTVTIGDYPEEDFFAWKHLIFSSAFYGAVGLWPSRDNIQTLADPNAYEDVLLANLLGGEIQLGHRIGECDFDLVRKTYREGDNLILKADRPIAPLDLCYRAACAAGYTESEHNGRKWYYLVNFPPSGSLTAFRLSDLHLSGKWAVYNHDAGTLAVTDAGTPVQLNSHAKHEYFILAPLLDNGMAVIGDTSKFVTMADMRIASVEAMHDSLRIGVTSMQDYNPIITGYSPRPPKSVTAAGQELTSISSVGRLLRANAGWLWDYQTGLWQVKVDFAGATSMSTKTFDINQ